MACVGEDGAPPSASSSSSGESSSSGGTSSGSATASSSGENASSSSSGAASSSGESSSSSGESSSSSGGQPQPLYLFLSQITQGDFAKNSDDPSQIADAICESSKTLNIPNGTYRALLSYQTNNQPVSALSRINDVRDRPIVRPDPNGAVTAIADNAVALFANGPLAPLDHNSTGAQVSITAGNLVQVWTGSNANGQHIDKHCNNWSTNDPSAFAAVGNAVAQVTDGGPVLAREWISERDNRSCATLRAYLYCFGPL